MKKLLQYFTAKVKALLLWFKRRKKLKEIYSDKSILSTETHKCPWADYYLVVKTFKTGAHTWNYTRGIVYKGPPGPTNIVAVVNRNYHHFPFTWVKHCMGDYLLCGEKYQGMTVIGLASGTKVSGIPMINNTPDNFCIAEYTPSPSGRYILLQGCYWGGIPEARVIRFDLPLSLSYTTIGKDAYEFEYAKYTWQGDECLLQELDKDAWCINDVSDCESMLHIPDPEDEFDMKDFNQQKKLGNLFKFNFCREWNARTGWEGENADFWKQKKDAERDFLVSKGIDPDAKKEGTLEEEV